MKKTRFAWCLAGVVVAVASAQDAPIADPGSLAFEQGRWEDVIREYRIILEKSPEDRLSLLRIAQAERELGRHERALGTLEQARVANAPEAMIDLERARNLLALGHEDDALAALEAADHVGLRAFELLDKSREFAPLRDERAFQRVHRSVRSRVYPCESILEAQQFDFWVGHWEVRQPDGTLAGRNTITKRDGGCTIHEQWEGTAGSSGTSTSFYIPSRDQWRQVWVGSGGTLIDMTGSFTDGAMRMEGTIEYVDQDRVVAFRGTWRPGPDGRIRQKLEEFDLASQGWQLWFDGFYRPVEE
jgi:tetratricopeptide (TPR) repeat protein